MHCIKADITIGTEQTPK